MDYTLHSTHTHIHKLEDVSRLSVPPDLRIIVNESSDSFLVLLDVFHKGRFEFWLDDQEVGECVGDQLAKVLPEVAQSVHSLQLITADSDAVLLKQGVAILFVQRRLIISRHQEPLYSYLTHTHTHTHIVQCLLQLDRGTYRSLSHFLLSP